MLIICDTVQPSLAPVTLTSIAKRLALKLSCVKHVLY